MTATADGVAIAYVDSLSNWGRWGPDDERGTLNLVDDAKRCGAAGLVEDGTVVSCAWELTDAGRTMKRSAEGLADPGRDPGAPRWHSTVERLDFQFHGLAVTHLDAPAHIFWDGRAYNDVPPDLVNDSDGARSLAVTAAAHGVVTRGVLLDLASAAGVDWLEPGSRVHARDLDRAERRCGTRVGAGDALLIRFGHGALRERLGLAAATNGTSSGLDADCTPWLFERDVALLGSDTSNDVSPLTEQALPLPVHVVGLRAMGLWLIDNAALETLGRECRRRARYEFLFTLAPLPITGATGSPVNPLAVF